MTALLITLNVLAGLFLVAVVLLQSGKGADMGAAFGGAGSTVFGPSGAGNLLTKITAGTAALFMGTSLALAVLSGRQASVFDDAVEPAPAPLTIPANPPVAAPPAAGEAGGAAGVRPEGDGGSASLGDDPAAVKEQAEAAVKEAVEAAAAKAAADAKAAQDAAGLGPAGQAAVPSPAPAPTPAPATESGGADSAPTAPAE